jgi:hypothetical protein
MSSLTFASPPTSSHETVGIFGAPILSEYEVRAFDRADSMSALVSGIPDWKRSDSVIPGLVVELFTIEWD